jgi:hypothetical protein
MGDRKLARAVPPIGNNQLMLIVGGRRQERGAIMGDRMTEQGRGEVIWWRHLTSTKSLPYLSSAYPGAAKGPELSGCAVSAVVSLCVCV